MAALGSVAAVVLTPAVAGALSVDVGSVTVPMTNSPASETGATAPCPTGTTLVGGGIRVFRAAGGTPGDTLKVNGTVPSDAAGVPARDGASNPSHWAALGGFAGQGEAGDQNTAFALCATGGPPGTTIEVTSVNQPQATATSARVTATCPGGTRMVGGGAKTTPFTSPNLKLIGSYPSDVAGMPVANGTVNPMSWTAVGGSGGGGSAANTTSAYAVCSPDPSRRIRVARVDEPNNPETASTQNPVTATCPSGTVLLGGGVSADLDGATPQQGIHLTGSFPSNASGTPVVMGSVGPSWTGVVRSGGQTAPGTDSRAFALCAEAVIPPGFDGKVTPVREVGSDTAYGLMQAIGRIYNAAPGCVLTQSNFSECDAVQPAAGPSPAQQRIARTRPSGTAGTWRDPLPGLSPTLAGFGLAGLVMTGARCRRHRAAR